MNGTRTAPDDDACSRLAEDMRDAHYLEKWDAGRRANGLPDQPRPPRTPGFAKVL